MKTIYKYPFKMGMNDSVWRHLMPIGSSIIKVGEQDDEVCMWAEVNLDLPLEARGFFIIGTGFSIPSDSTYVGSVQMDSGLVWHVYEENGNEDT